MDARAKEVLTFWLEDAGQQAWYTGGEAFDQEVRDRFQSLWDQAPQLTSWCCTARGTLAFLILTDQFPRNMFRGEARAFATDALACSVAKRAVTAGVDLRVDMPERQFFYMPLEHSESLADQARAVRMMLLRSGSPELLLHARAHREVIRRYGRFPYRNDALGRSSSRSEAEMVEAGGYGAVVRELQAA